MVTQTGTRDKRRILKAYTIVEKPGDQKDFWLNIGVASDNRDGSLSVKLDALPMNGLLHIREYEPRKNDGGHGMADRNNQNNW